MRIFISCQQSLRQHPIPAYSFWEIYFKNGIKEAGYEWIEADGIDWAEGLVYADSDDSLKSWRDRTWNLTLAFIKQQHQRQPIDLFLSYLFPKQIEPSAIQEIQALGIACVNFFCDNVREFRQVPKAFHGFDLHWVPEYKALKMYEHSGLNYLYAPMPAWVSPQYRNFNHPENHGISFIGSRDLQREKLLAEAIKFCCELEIRGEGWLGKSEVIVNHPKRSPQNIWQKINRQSIMIQDQGLRAWFRKIQAKFAIAIPNEIFTAHVKEQPNFAQYIEIIQQSQITLGINRYPSFNYPFNLPNTYSRMRDIEAPMLGACYLTEWTEGLEDLYELGSEIETYASVEEMIAKIRDLQAQPQKRQAMRKNAQIKALEKHTISVTLRKIFKKLDL
jgi:hypothetical protein